VKFGDLDLSRRSDTKILIHRIRVAAHDVCSVNGYAPAQQLCYQKAVSDALKQISQRQPSIVTRLAGPSTL
jgi:UrcA family protein